MNLYKLHSNPKELDFHDEAHEKVPSVFWKKYKKNPAELKKREDHIAKSADYSYEYALNVLKKKPFPKGGEAISKDAYYSYQYSRDILKAPFPKGEDAIAKSTYRLGYALYVLTLPEKQAEAWGKNK